MNGGRVQGIIPIHDAQEAGRLFETFFSESRYQLEVGTLLEFAVPQHRDQTVDARRDRSCSRRGATFLRSDGAVK